MTREERRAIAEERAEEERKYKAAFSYGATRILYDEHATPAEIAFAVAVLDEVHGLNLVPYYAKHMGPAQQADIAEFAKAVRARMNETE